MLTFSINPKLNDDKLQKIDRLIKQTNDKNREYAGISFINIVSDKALSVDEIGDVNLSSVKYLGIMRDRAKKEKSKVQSWEKLTEEIDADCMNISEFYEFEEDLVKRLDYEDDCIAAVEAFIRLREKIFFKCGRDIWRLVELGMIKDAIAIRKLKELFTYEADNSVLYNVLSDPHVFKMLKNILDS